MHSAISERRVVVLVHDDSLRKFVSLVLERTGVVVYGTADVASALAETQRQPPDAIVCKHRRGIIDSVEVCARLRRDPGTSTVPVILLTADGRAGHHRRFLQAGGSAVLQLPFTAEELNAALAPHLARSRS